MPRKERPLDQGDDRLLEFAADLRELRERCGRPPYRELGRRAHFSAAALCDAAGGRRLPSLAVTKAYVRACGGPVADWERRWHRLAAALRPADPGPRPPDRRLPPFAEHLLAQVGGLLVRVGGALVAAGRDSTPTGSR